MRGSKNVPAAVDEKTAKNQLRIQRQATSTVDSLMNVEKRNRSGSTVEESKTEEGEKKSM
jgi:hypothetical protein